MLQFKAGNVLRLKSKEYGGLWVVHRVDEDIVSLRLYSNPNIKLKLSKEDIMKEIE